MREIEGFEARVRRLRRIPADEMRTRDGRGALVAAVARSFLGAPYLARPLERPGPERLVVNVSAFDCVTYVETVLALARVLSPDGASTDAFVRALEYIRYRGGRIDGYASRLHYFTDWIRDNRAKGVICDLTPQIGGAPWDKRVDYMTAHRDRYPPLADDETFRRMASVESELTAMPKHHLPRERVRAQEDLILDGDILAVTAAQPGMDVLHVGFALRRRGRVHLLHASETAGRVDVSPETLHRYLHRRQSRTGLLIARACGDERE